MRHRKYFWIYFFLTSNLETNSNRHSSRRAMAHFVSLDPCLSCRPSIDYPAYFDSTLCSDCLSVWTRLVAFLIHHSHPPQGHAFHWQNHLNGRSKISVKPIFQKCPYPGCESSNLSGSSSISSKRSIMDWKFTWSDAAYLPWLLCQALRALCLPLYYWIVWPYAGAVAGLTNWYLRSAFRLGWVIGSQAGSSYLTAAQVAWRWRIVHFTLYLLFDWTVWWWAYLQFDPSSKLYWSLEV